MIYPRQKQVSFCIQFLKFKARLNKMNNFLIKALSFFLTMYFASLIIFPLYYSYIRYIFDALVIITFIFLMFPRKEKIYQLNSVIIFYVLFAILVLAGSLWGVDFKSSGLISVQLFLIVINLFVFYNLMKEYDGLRFSNNKNYY